MDRVAQLAEEADAFIEMERANRDILPADTARWATRATLAEIARDLGFPENEISSAIDTALGGR